MDVAQTREWARSLPRIKDDERRLIFAALDAFEALGAAARQLNREELSAVEEAARSRWVAAWDVGGRALAELACQHVAAQEAFRELVASPASSERFQAISSLSARMPAPLLRELLTRGLNDRSKKVRVRAAMTCDTLRLEELLPELERRAGVEPDAEVEYELRFHAAMIRDGYLVERKGRGRLSLCVRTRDGWSWQDISRADLDDGRVPALVAERQAQPF